MKTIAETLEQIVDQYSAPLLAVSEDAYSYKASAVKWSKKEILGHLSDSAMNNIRRFVMAQYEENPLISYNQDRWVAISHYRDYPTKDLVALWSQLNRHACIILKNTTAEAARRTCDVRGPQLYSVEWLAHDYIKHLRHHLHQILELEPVGYP